MEVRDTGTEVTDIWQMSCEHWELNLCPLQGYMLLKTESTLDHPSILKNK